MFQRQSIFLKEIDILRAGGIRRKVNKKRIEANFLVSVCIQPTSSMKT
jgi:hypothetical protein